MECGTPPTPVEDRYKVVGYADDAKPAITSKKEFFTVDKSCAIFEEASSQACIKFTNSPFEDEALIM